MRFPNSTVGGSGFGGVIVSLVWRKGKTVPGHDSAEWRKDAYGNWMKFSAYGDTKSQYGWEIDHIYPVSKGGEDRLDNLQPLFWKANRHKADNISNQFTPRLNQL